MAPNVQRTAAYQAYPYFPTPRLSPTFNACSLMRRPRPCWSAEHSMIACQEQGGVLMATQSSATVRTGGIMGLWLAQ